MVHGREQFGTLLDHSQNYWIHLFFWPNDTVISSKTYNGLFPSSLLSRLKCVTEKYILSPN